MANTNTEPQKTKVVRYKNDFPFAAREITAAQWKTVNAEGQKTTVWDSSNNWEIPASEFNEAALRYIERDPDLVVVEV